jgi:hypothetical protein
LDDEKGDPLFGECRRYPPSQKKSGEIVDSGAKGERYMMDWSRFEIITYKDDWCGEYKSWEAKSDD